VRAWKQRLHALLASTDELEADDEVVEAALHGTQPVSAVRPRGRYTVSGVVRSITFPPSDHRPELVVELYDGSASLDLRWLGRREIPGIEPGRRLIASGRVTTGDGSHRLVMYNPSYTLLQRRAAP
jgi:hypothetical protein